MVGFDFFWPGQCVFSCRTFDVFERLKFLKYSCTYLHIYVLNEEIIKVQLSVLEK